MKSYLYQKSIICYLLFIKKCKLPITCCCVAPPHTLFTYKLCFCKPLFPNKNGLLYVQNDSSCGLYDLIGTSHGRTFSQQLSAGGVVC